MLDNWEAVMCTHIKSNLLHKVSFLGTHAIRSLHLSHVVIMVFISSCFDLHPLPLPLKFFGHKMIVTEMIQLEFWSGVGWFAYSTFLIQ
jgi:hypothetical protein